VPSHSPRRRVHEGGALARTLMLRSCFAHASLMLRSRFKTKTLNIAPKQKIEHSVDALLYMPALSLPRARSKTAATQNARVGKEGEAGAGTGAGERGVRMREGQVVRKRTRRRGVPAPALPGVGEGGGREGGKEGDGGEGGEGEEGEGADVNWAVDGDVMLKEEKSFVLSGCPDGIIRVWEVLFRTKGVSTSECVPKP
jgi:hypothetical protein